MLFGFAQLILSFLIRLKLNHFSTAYSTQTNMDSDSTIFKSKCQLTRAAPAIILADPADGNCLCVALKQA